MKYPHWEYLVAICEDVERTARFVEPVTENFRTFSIEFVRLYLAIGSEIDVVAKLLCKKIQPNCKLSNSIDSYRPVICTAYPKLPDLPVHIPRHGIELHPWREWNSNKNPPWWQSYNAVKHERNAFFSHANLGNTFNALAGLLIMTGYLYGEALENSELQSPSKLMKFPREYWSGAAMGEDYKAGYRLPGIPKRKRP